MNKIKLDSDSLKLITFFESMTGAKIKDCISNEKLILIVDENEMAKAIGKNGSNIKKVESRLKKKIKLVEFSSDVSQFVRNIAYPAEVLEIEQKDGAIIVHGKDASSKAMLVGREHQNINNLTNIVKRYFDVKEIKVV